MQTCTCSCVRVGLRKRSGELALACKRKLLARRRVWVDDGGGELISVGGVARTKSPVVGGVCDL